MKTIFKLDFQNKEDWKFGINIFAAKYKIELLFNFDSFKWIIQNGPSCFIWECIFSDKFHNYLLEQMNENFRILINVGQFFRCWVENIVCRIFTNYSNVGSIIRIFMWILMDLLLTSRKYLCRHFFMSIIYSHLVLCNLYLMVILRTFNNSIDISLITFISCVKYCQFRKLIIPNVWHIPLGNNI